MELSEQLAARSAWLDLQWLPRQQNEHADALTNGHFGDFTNSNRVVVDLKGIKWRVLDSMLEAGQGMVVELEEARAARRARRKRLDVESAALRGPEAGGKRPRRERLRFAQPWG
eukprot:3172725-Lingulodinium_polyedra.AAC.1